MRLRRNDSVSQVWKSVLNSKLDTLTDVEEFNYVSAATKALGMTNDMAGSAVCHSHMVFKVV